MSVVEAGRQRLIEAEGTARSVVGLGLSVREVEGGRLIEEEVTLWRAARGGAGRGADGAQEDTARSVVLQDGAGEVRVVV